MQCLFVTPCKRLFYPMKSTMRERKLAWFIALIAVIKLAHIQLAQWMRFAILMINTGDKRSSHK